MTSSVGGMPYFGRPKVVSMISVSACRHCAGSAARPGFPELQQVLAPGAAESLAHEARGAGVGDDLGVRSEVIAVRVRHESAGLARVRIEPERVLGQVQAAVVAEGNHGSNKVTAESV